MKRSIIIGLMFILPALSLAATYQYVDIYGRMRTVEAPNDFQATMIANANQADPHSGVMLSQGNTVAVQTTPVIVATPVVATFQTSTTFKPGQYQYKYVDIYGNVKVVTAPNVTNAEVMATDKDPNSGFQIVG